MFRYLFKVNNEDTIAYMTEDVVQVSLLLTYSLLSMCLFFYIKVEVTVKPSESSNRLKDFQYTPNRVCYQQVSLGINTSKFIA